MAMTGGTPQLVHTGYGNGNTSYPIKVYVYYKTSQNTDNNTSTITCGMYVTTVSSTYKIGPWTDFNGSYVGTTGNTFSGTIPEFAGTRWLVENKQFTVQHNNDGTGTATIKWHWGVNSTWGKVQNPSGSFTITLPTIPRGSSFTLNKSNVNVGETIAVSITKANSSYTDTIAFSYPNGGNTYVSYTLPTNQTEFTIPVSWYNVMPSSRSMTAYCTVTTSNSGGEIAQSKKSFTVNVPSNIKPSINSFTATVRNGYTSNSKTYYVQGKSNCYLSVNAEAGKGSKISSYSITGSGVSSTSSTTSTAYTYTTPTITASGKITYTAKVSDLRPDSTATTTCSINVLPYGNPTISISAERSSISDTSIFVSVNGKCSPLNCDGQDNNAISSIVIYYKKKGSSGSYTAKNVTFSSSSSVTTQYTLNNIDGESEYDIYATIADTAYSSSAESKHVYVKTASRPLNINPNKTGVAIGKMSSTSKNKLFDVGWNTNIDGWLDVGGDITFGGNDGQTAERKIRFHNPSTSAHPHNCTVYGGNPESATDIGIWDTLNNRSVFYYLSESNDGEGAIGLLGNELKMKVPMTFDGITSLNNTPSGATSYGRYLRFVGSSDNYYINVDSNGQLFTGTALNKATDITWKTVPYCESGYDSTTGFYYQKWSNGAVEMWKTEMLSSFAITTQSGNIYYSANVSKTLPVSLLTGAYASVTCDGVVWSAIVSCSNSTLIFRLLRGSSITTNIECRYYIKGIWKTLT